MPTNTEDHIFRDAYRYFTAHHTPPPMSALEAAADWWKVAADDMGRLSAQWHNHPLMDKLLIAIYEYLEQKAKEAQV